MKRNKQKEENKEEEEKYQLSKFTQAIIVLVFAVSIVFRLPPLATGILWGFMPIVVTFDVVRQQQARKEGVKWC